MRKSSSCHAILGLLVVFPFIAQPKPAYCNREVKVRVTDQRLVIVPVMINGQGPYSFLLDTGSSATVVKPELISRLQAKPIGTSDFLAGVQAHRVTWYWFDSIGLEGAEIGPVGVIGFPLDNHRSFDLDGILGQDILRHYNYLLDYKRRLIVVDEDQSLAASLSGPTAPLVETKDRLVVMVAPKSERKKSPLFVLDSGANCLVIFRQDYEDYGLDVLLRIVTEVQTAGGSSLIRTGVVRSFRIGGKDMNNVPVAFVPATAYTAGRPELGTFPLKWFDSVYVNHTQNLVAFEPKFRSQKEPQTILAKTVKK